MRQIGIKEVITIETGSRTQYNAVRRVMPRAGLANGRDSSRTASRKQKGKAMIRGISNFAHQIRRARVRQPGMR
jgi:ribosomal protein S5